VRADALLGGAGDLSQVAVGEAILLRGGQHVVGRKRGGMVLGVGDEGLLLGHQLGHLLDEPALDARQFVELVDRGTGA